MRNALFGQADRAPARGAGPFSPPRGEWDGACGTWPRPEGDGVPVIDRRQFARARAGMSDAAFAYHVYCHLLDADAHLETVLRADGDFAVLAAEARLLAAMTEEIGAMRVHAAACRLEGAATAGNPRDCEALVRELARGCAGMEAELRDFLDRQARAKGAA